VRPKRIMAANDGSWFVGYNPGKGGSIHWNKWTRSVARGVGTCWLNDFEPDAAEGTLYPHRAVIIASRVRHAHYTRVTLRYRGGDLEWDEGDTVYVQHWRLRPFPPYGYNWF
jgi:hypothetical protein